MKTILEQVAKLPQLKAIKDRLLASQVIQRLIGEKKPMPFSLFLLPLVSDYLLEYEGYSGNYEAVEIIDVIWHLFKEELAPLYALTKVDLWWVQAELIKDFEEAKELMAKRQA